MTDSDIQLKLARIDVALENLYRMKMNAFSRTMETQVDAQINRLEEQQNYLMELASR